VIKRNVIALINYLREMKRKAHGAQKPRHIKRIVEVASTAQRGDSLAQVINQRFINHCSLTNKPRAAMARRRQSDG